MARRGLGRTILVLTLCAWFETASAGAAPVPGSAPSGAGIQGVDRLMTDAAEKGFGGALIIEQGDATLLSKGYGFADRKRRIPFTPDTIAQVGSITKSQTGAAIATLIAEGKVALSDPVSKDNGADEVTPLVQAVLKAALQLPPRKQPE